MNTQASSVSWTSWRKSSYSDGSLNGDCVEIAWRKSSHSDATLNGDCVEIAWRKSSHSDGLGNGNCVEIAFAADAVAVRDSKNAAGPTLTFGPGRWRAFLASAR